MRNQITWIVPSVFVTTLLLLAVLAGAAGCAPAAEVSRQVEALFSPAQTSTPTPFQPFRPTASPTITPTPTLSPTATPEPLRELLVWLDPALPQSLLAGLRLPAGARMVAQPEDSNLRIGIQPDETNARTFWVYALVAPFPTIRDEASLEEIQRAWRGEAGDDDFAGMLLVSPSTRAAFSAAWGAPGSSRLRTLPEDQILDAAWNKRDDWAILPFEQIEPRWKVLQVDGISPLAPDFDLLRYPLVAWFGAGGQEEALRLLEDQLPEVVQLLPAGNRDPKKLTTLVMTGVTALTRATAYKMDTLGTAYPGRDIQHWLREADLTHISNEVSFNTTCPLSDFYRITMRFCSRPEYIELLEFIGTNIVELSGNHVNDYDRHNFTYSLELYRERGWHVFAGGANIAEARAPAKVEHNGNRLAFIGCNPVGPPHAWATDDLPGAAPCEDMAWLLESIRALRSEGYLPIVTFQHYERYVYHPTPAQERDFRAVIDAGAVIASGSHAHFPHYMELYNGAFIHYGLGNLFFDQMDIPVPGTRREFIDRHTFYDGRYIHTELLTALLEDYARPRPMTPAERESMLSDIFRAAGW
jgi:hypothetical protein